MSPRRVLLSVATPVVVGVGAGAWLRAHARASAVQGWRPTGLEGRHARSLFVRTAGSAETVVVLLHGLVASGDTFGAPYDHLVADHTLVVPDLAGFGRSLRHAGSQLTPDDHLDALDGLLDELGLGSRPLVIGAHSMGAAVAIRWAARLRDRARRIVMWGAPTFPDPRAADGAVRDLGIMARLFATESHLARVVCDINCRHRTAAGWFAAATHPSLPVPIARAASLHTWTAYRDAMHFLVARTSWQRLCADAAAAGTDLHFVWGSEDHIGDRDLVQGLPGVMTTEVPDADHHLPLSHGHLCADQLDE